MSKQIIKGNELQLFINNNAPCWATSHTLTLGTESSSVNTKDHGLYQSNNVTALTWELSGEFLYSTTDVDMFIDMQIAAQPVDIAFSKVSNFDTAGLIRAGGTVAAWQQSPMRLKGKAIISNITANAAAGDNATYTVTFTGTSSLSQSLPTDDYIELVMDLNTSRPILFEVANWEANIAVYNAETGNEIPTVNEEGVITYTGRDNLNDVTVRIKMGGTYIIGMNANLGGDNITINMSTVPSFLWFNAEDTGIKDIIFGNNVKSISACAFDGRPGTDTSLRYQSLPIIPPTMGQDGLGNIAEVISITVPEGTLDAYQTAWSGYSAAEWVEV